MSGSGETSCGWGSDHNMDHSERGARIAPICGDEMVLRVVSLEIYPAGAITAVKILEAILSRLNSSWSY